MRIIAGNLGGRTFQSPSGHRTHPMSDKIRGALFNMLGDIEGLTVLDAFSGSGALGFEAVSRGASHVTAIDIDKNAAAIALKNAQELAISNKIKVIRANASSWSDTNRNKMFDLVLIDPPYDDVRPNLLTKLAAHTKPGGVLVASLPPHTRAGLSSQFRELTHKSYGDAELTMHRRISVSADKPL